VLVGVLFKKFGLFLNTPRIPFIMEMKQATQPDETNFEVFVVLKT
jgi:hypothetical protein